MRYVTARLPGAPAPEYGSCPRCGAYWGHPDPALDFPNRQKVDQHWKCYNPSCTCAYYDPETNRVVEDKLSPEAEAALKTRVHADVTAMLADKIWISRGNTHKPWPASDPIPEGWTK